MSGPAGPARPGTRGHHEHLLRKHYGGGRSLGDRAADRFVAVFGSWSYIIWQTAVIVAWMIGNTLILRSWAHLHHVPDPYPFILLNLGFSAQASYAAPLILMAQNRGTQRDKDFAADQFEIIDTSHQLLRQNTDLTQAVHSLTAQIHAAITAPADTGSAEILTRLGVLQDQVAAVASRQGAAAVAADQVRADNARAEIADTQARRKPRIRKPPDGQS